MARGQVARIVTHRTPRQKDDVGFCSLLFLPVFYSGSIEKCKG